MLKIIIGLVLLLTFNAEAGSGFCNGLSSKVDNNSIYAEVSNSKSHLEMDLVMVSKLNAYESGKIKIKGGSGYSKGNLPSCDSDENTPVEWLNNHIATHKTHSFDYWSATYRICLYDVRNQLKDSFTICNYNTGD
jgi:hypothetical protein